MNNRLIKVDFTENAVNSLKFGNLTAVFDLKNGINSILEIVVDSKIGIVNFFWIMPLQYQINYPLCKLKILLEKKF